MSFAKTLFFEAKQDSLLRDGLIVLLSSLLIGLCGKIAIPLPFTPVPFVIQNTLILFLSLLLGPRRGTSIVFCFLAQAALGLPVLALGKAGLLVFSGPTGGYLIGYLAAAFVTGWIGERVTRKTLVSAFLSLAAGSGVIYLFGAAYLSLFIGVKQAIFAGIIPFLIGDLFKTVAALKVLQWVGWNKSSCR